MATATPATPVKPKSRRRWYVAAFVVIFLTTPIAYYYIAGWLRDRELDALYREMDEEDPHWRWPDLVANLPAPPPDDQNAALQINKVRDLLKATPFNQVRWKGKGKQPPQRLGDEHVAALRASFNKLGPDVVKEARKLKNFPEGRFPVEFVENPFDRTVASAVDLKVLEMMRLLKHDAMLLLVEGKTEEAAESCQALLHTAHAINDAPGLLSMLIRDAGDVDAIDAIERTLVHGVVSSKRLELLQGSLVKETESKMVYHAFRGERAMSHQYYVLVREGKATYAGAVGPSFSRYPAGIVDMFPRLFLGDYATDLRLRNEQIRASKLEEEAQVAAFAEVEKKIKHDGTLLAIGTALIHGVHAEHRATEIKLRCAITALAAERFRLEHGQWPDSAEQLVKRGWLKKVYVDPEDGKPLAWKRTPTGIVISANVRAGVSFELSRPVVDKK